VLGTAPGCPPHATGDRQKANRAPRRRIALPKAQSVSSPSPAARYFLAGMRSPSLRPNYLSRKLPCGQHHVEVGLSEFGAKKINCCVACAVGRQDPLHTQLAQLGNYGCSLLLSAISRRWNPPASKETLPARPPAPGGPCSQYPDVHTGNYHGPIPRFHRRACSTMEPTGRVR